MRGRKLGLGFGEGQMKREVDSSGWQWLCAPRAHGVLVHKCPLLALCTPRAVSALCACTLWIPTAHRALQLCSGVNLLQLR